MTRWIRTLAVVVVLAVVSVATAADKTITQKVVTLAEIDRLTIDRAGLTAASPYIQATYRVLDATGAQIGHHRVVKVPLTAGQVSTLQSFTTTVVVPAANTKEGT